MRQRHCASEIHYAINQEVWSKINAHPGLFAWATIITLLSFPGWWTTCYHLRSVDLPNNDLLVLQCFSRWSVLCRLSWCRMHQTVDSYYHFSDVFSLAGGCNEIDCSLYFSRYPCSGSVQVAIWYCFVIKHRRRWLEVARGWFKPICRILA